MLIFLGLAVGAVWLYCWLRGWWFAAVLAMLPVAFMALASASSVDARGYAVTTVIGLVAWIPCAIKLGWFETGVKLDDDNVGPSGDPPSRLRLHFPD